MVTQSSVPTRPPRQNDEEHQSDETRGPASLMYSLVANGLSALWKNGLTTATTAPSSRSKRIVRQSRQRSTIPSDIHGGHPLRIHWGHTTLGYEYVSEHRSHTRRQIFRTADDHEVTPLPGTYSIRVNSWFPVRPCLIEKGEHRQKSVTSDGESGSCSPERPPASRQPVVHQEPT